MYVILYLRLFHKHVVRTKFSLYVFTFQNLERYLCTIPNTVNKSIIIVINILIYILLADAFLFVCLISAISRRSVFLLEETGGPRENHQPVASHCQTLSHNAVHLALIEILTHISGDSH